MSTRSLLRSLGHLLLLGGALHLMASPAGAARPPAAPNGYVAQTGWSFESDVANRNLGTSATTAGDVNGDGYSDVVAIGRVGASSAALYLFFGGPLGPTLAPGYPITNVPTGTAGPSLNAAGDLNGDGFADIVLGFPNGVGGSIRVYYGSASGLDLAHPFEYTVTFPPSFGQVVGPAGDVNGDGFDDLIVGLPQAGPALQICGGGSFQGRVDVYYGSAAGLRTDNPWILWGCQWFSSGTFIGSSAGTAGDVNADSYDDIVIGGNGIAYVVYGSSIGLPIRPNSFGEGWLSGATQINAFNAGDGTGLASCGAGDLNGDGFADVLIGSPSDDTYATDCGFARALLGSASGLQTGSIFWQESSISAFAHFGGTLGAAGDINGDGLADVLVGEASRIGVFQSFGSTLFSTINPINISGSSRSFATAGDVNGDGLSDIVVGDGGYSNGESLEGQLLYFAGRGEGPTTAPSWSMKTMLDNPNLGWSVSSAGDVNADGLDDYIMGAPTLPNLAGGEVNNGGVFMNFGKIGGPTPNFSDWSSLGSPGDQLGVAVASAYDINGDGYADFVAGAHAGGTGIGKAFVYYGHANPWSSSSAANLILSGATAGGQFGAAVAGGDFNGDGYGDVAVGAPMNDGPNKGTPSHAGQVFVYLGGPLGLNSTPAWTGSGTQADEHYGASLCADADVNGDGYMDLVVGAPQHDAPGQVDAGALIEYHGRSVGAPLLFYQTMEGDKTGYGVGQALAHAGDVNGDGYGDVITGEPNANGGQAEVFAGTSSGLNPLHLWVHSKFEVGSGFGSSVSCAGDVNGDGLSDVLVGAVFEDGGGAQDRGCVRVFPGPLAGGGPLWTAFGATAFQNFGHASANAGDVNGDGWNELIFGEPGYSVDLFRQGICELYMGAAGRGRVRLGSATATGHRIVPLGLADASSFTLTDITRSAAGRTRLKMQWDVQRVPALAGPPLSGVQSAYTLTGVPGVLGSYALIQQPVSGLLTGQPYAWRMRTRSRSVYFPTTTWFQPTRSGSREYDLRSPGTWVGVDDAPRIPAVVEMAAPRPNPMHAQSLITFALPQAGHVSLAILDVQGRTLRTLVDGGMTAGPHQVSWDGTGDDGTRAAAGVYFYRLETAGKRMSQKVALLP